MSERVARRGPQIKEEGKGKSRTFIASRDLAILPLFLLLAFAFLLPGSLHLGRALLGYPGDSFQHAWFLWHFARAVSHGHNPYFTNLIFYPHRVSLAWSTLDPLASLIALPFSLVAGPVVAYNASLIVQLALTGFFAYLLWMRICGNVTAAVVGGACFGFSPWLMGEALGHLSLVTAFPIPLFLLMLDAMLEGATGRWKDGIALGFALFLTALAHYNYTVFCILVAFAIVGVDLAVEGWAHAKRIWRPLVGAALTFGILFSPMFVSMWGNRSARPQSRPFALIEDHAADLLGWFVPSWNHLIFGQSVRHWNAGLFSAGYEGVTYFGPVIAIFAAIGLWAGRRRNSRWTIRLSAAALIFWVLSLGPHIRVWGRDTGVPGPAFLFYISPFGRFVSAPARFYVITALCFAGFVAMGVAYMLKKLSSSGSRIIATAAVSALLALDLLPVPFPVATSAASATYPGFDVATNGCSVPADVAGATVVTVPELKWPFPVRAMWMQIADGGRYALADGYVSYGPDSIWDKFWTVPVFRSVRSVQDGEAPPMDAAAVRASMPNAIRDLNLGAFVVFDSPQGQRAVEYLKQVLGQNGVPQATCTVFDLHSARSANAGSLNRVAVAPSRSSLY
jgi:hypothetical protein